MKYEVKFEWIFVTLLLVILTSIFFFVSDTDMRNVILVAFTSAFSGGVGYIYGKTRPDN